jgi:hypothetical protein
MAIRLHPFSMYRYIFIGCAYCAQIESDVLYNCIYLYPATRVCIHHTRPARNGYPRIRSVVPVHCEPTNLYRTMDRCNMCYYVMVLFSRINR